MENNESKVELVSTPKIETRFGYGVERRHLSKAQTQVCVGLSVFVLIAIFFLKTPEQKTSGPGIGSPELSNQGQKIDFDLYSITEENRLLKNQKVFTRQAPSLPGLEKINRNRNIKIPGGSSIKAKLISGATDGPVQAEVTASLRVQGESAIPEGATLVGSGTSSDDRLIVKFSKVLLRDGSSFGVSGYAVDLEDPFIGLKGSKISREAKKYAASIGLSFLSGVADGLKDREAIGSQVVEKNSIRNSLLNGASRAALEVANENLNELKNKAPIIVIEPGKEILVRFDENQN